MNLKQKFPSESDLVKRKRSLRQFFITTFLLSLACLLGIIIVIVIEFFYGEFLDLFWYGEYFPQLVLMILIPSGIILGILSFYFIRKYRFLNRKVKRKLFYNPELNDHILQFLIDNQKQKFTSIMIHKKLNYIANVEEVNAALTYLVDQKKVSVEYKEGVLFYFIDLEALGLI